MQPDVDDLPPVEPGDLELARACAAGDTAARRRFVREYHPHLTRFLGNKVARQQIGDLVQDVFVRLFSRSLGAYSGQGRLRSFVLGVAYRCALEHFREDYRVARRGSWEGEPSERRPSPSRVAAQKGRRHTLCAELRRLPRELQEVLEFFYWNELTTAEIAAIVGAPVGTIKWRLARARELLKQRLAATNFDSCEWIELSSTSSR